MNTHALAKHYGALTPRERLPLLVAARLRHDDAEEDRLLRSAPTGLYRVPHHFGLVETLSDLALLHVVQQLESAAWLWRIEATLESCALLGRKGAASEDRNERLFVTLRLRAYLMTIEREAWRRFCAELNVDADTLLRDFRLTTRWPMAKPLLRNSPLPRKRPSPPPEPGGAPTRKCKPWTTSWPVSALPWPRESAGGRESADRHSEHPR
jgi:hypothetical protein